MKPGIVQNQDSLPNQIKRQLFTFNLSDYAN